LSSRAAAVTRRLRGPREFSPTGCSLDSSRPARPSARRWRRRRCRAAALRDTAADLRASASSRSKGPSCAARTRPRARGAGRLRAHVRRLLAGGAALCRRGARRLQRPDRAVASDRARRRITRARRAPTRPAGGGGRPLPRRARRRAHGAAARGIDPGSFRCPLPPAPRARSRRDPLAAAPQLLGGFGPGSPPGSRRYAAEATAVAAVRDREASRWRGLSSVSCTTSIRRSTKPASQYARYIRHSRRKGSS